MKKQYIIPQVDAIVMAKPLCYIGDGGSGPVLPPSEPGSAPARKGYHPF